MSALAAIRHGRRWAESLMVDTCVIRRATGNIAPMDPDTGLRTTAAAIVVYTGKCKVQTYEPAESKPESGQHVWTTQRYAVHLPHGAGPVAVDDRIEITASAVSPQLVGNLYRISGTHTKSLATAQRLLVDEVTA